ncbi:MAG TPA: GNAT family N-acetyltransferase [Streptosporangiaceae bacterium]|nr:GNAT family N-acetyltransferase [Streptosporangiaceae bacterium]
MPELTAPTVRVHASFLAAMKEFQDEGRGGYDDATLVGREIAQYAGRWADPAVFAGYVRWLAEEPFEDSPRPQGYVPSTTLWWVSGDEYLGRLAIRHRLTPQLRDYGGHIGYDVRPTARRRGHATAMLAAALPRARALGIDPVLVTCDEDNVGSRKVIEANQGVLEDKRGIKLRFWVPAA